MPPTPLRSLAEVVREEGAAVWRTFLDKGALDHVRSATTALAQGSHAHAYPKSTRVWDLFRHGDIFVDLLSDRPLNALLTELLGEHHLLSDCSLNVVHSHQPIDDWHIDYPYNEMPTLVAGSVLGLQCVLAVDAFTSENGATQFVPGSHAPPRRPVVTEVRGAVIFEAEPGDLLVMAATTWHRSGHNTSGEPRTAILLSFVERWVRPMLDPPEPGRWGRDRELGFFLARNAPLRQSTG